MLVSALQLLTYRTGHCVIRFMCVSSGSSTVILAPDGALLYVYRLMVFAQTFSAPKVGWIRNSQFRCILRFTFLRNRVLFYLDSEAVLWMCTFWMLLLMQSDCTGGESLVILLLLEQLSRVPLCHFFLIHISLSQLPALARNAATDSRNYSHFKCPSPLVGWTALCLLAVNSVRPKFNRTNHDWQRTVLFLAIPWNSKSHCWIRGMRCARQKTLGLWPRGAHYYKNVCLVLQTDRTV